MVVLNHKLAAIHATSPADYGGVLVPLEFATEAGLLSLISTTTVFGTPRDITLSDLALEAFFPANADGGDALAAQCERRGVSYSHSMVPGGFDVTS